MRNNTNSWRRPTVILTALLLLGGAVAVAQGERGNVYGTVADEEGSPLPGVSVTLSGIGAPRVQVSNAQGEFRFPGLDPGVYRLEAELDGYSPLTYERVTVNIGRNTTLNLQMSSAVAETITVTGESPLIDQRKITTGATVSQIELEKIPTARDPWVILGTTPGVQLDRVNIGGNESGQQSSFTGPGDDGTNASFSIDGVEITDIGAIGSSSAYYDFDAFEEMQITTGGSDAAKRTGGVGVNLVTKRGTNEFRGSGRYLTADGSWQSNTDLDERDLAPDQPSFKQGNRIVENEDYGAEIGGPILPDRLWFWVAYGENEIHNLTVDDVSDKTTLESTNAKINWQVVPNNSLTAFYFDNEKIKIGRNAGPTRPQPTTWNQGALLSDGDVFPFDPRPTVLKIEDSHIFGPNFYGTIAYAENDGGFFLTPQGSLSFEDTWRNPDQPKAALDEDFVWHNTFLHYQSERPQQQGRADGSYFFDTGNLSHELRFGANYREGTVDSLTRWPGGGLDLNFYAPNYGYPYNIVGLTRDGRTVYEVTYTNGYIQDTISAGNVTFNAGVRYDLQEAEFLPTVAEGNPIRPDLLPDAVFAGGDVGYDWTTLSPRLGVTYDLGGRGKTLLRASYARFAEQLGGQAIFGNPLYPYAAVYFYYDDRNGDDQAQPDELLDIWDFTSAYNPFDPSAAFTSDLVDSGLDPPLSDELVFSVEHALLPEFVIGANLTYRLNSDLVGRQLLVFDGDAFSEENLNQAGRLHRRDDYVLKEIQTVTRPDGSTIEVPVYGLRDGVTTRNGGLIENIDSEQQYYGISLVAHKRLANRWMLRGHVTWADAEWDVPAHEVVNPNLSFNGLPFDEGTSNGSARDGGALINCVGTGSGAKGSVCMSPGWGYDLTGLYQIMPDRIWGFDVSAHLYGREGYAIPYNRGVPAGLTGYRGTGPSGRVNLAATREVDEFNNEDLHFLDLGLSKEFRLKKVGLTLSADLFNVLNEATVLQEQLVIGSTQGFVQEVASPRIWRLGARISFN